MSGSGYDAVVDVDDEVRLELTFGTVARLIPPYRSLPRTLSRHAQFGAHVANSDCQGDLGHTDLQDDLEFHQSNFNDAGGRKGHHSSSGGPGLPPPATASSGGGSGSSKRFLWTLSFYAQFFDVDTSAVLSRCWAALFPRANFLDVLEGNPDLYGPFWIATTVVLILFLGGTVSQYLSTTGSTPFAYDFKLLSGMSLLPHGEMVHLIS
jgi:hypothetical protein